MPQGIPGSVDMRAPLRRGACPALRAPMATGDGLLARFLPDDPALTPAMLRGIAEAAERCGNGIVEITQRGALQVRGLRAGTVEDFAAAIEDLGIAVTGTVPVHVSPLSGIDPGELLDMRPLAASLRRLIAAEGLVLSPKVSVLFDGGGAAVHLDALSADVRIAAERAGEGVVCRLSAGGTAGEAFELGAAPVAEAVAAAAHPLRRIAAAGRSARARDLLHQGAAAFAADLPVRFEKMRPPPARPASEPVGMHECRNGKAAIGIGLAFGSCTSRSLQAILDAALSAGAESLALAPRTLLATGLPSGAVPAFRDAAAALGFVVDAADARNRIAACPGAPACALGWIATREIAAALAARISPRETLHVSGCAKGCAHPRPAAVVVVGRPDGCGIAFGARADGEPAAVVPVGELAAAIAARRILTADLADA